MQCNVCDYLRRTSSGSFNFELTTGPAGPSKETERGKKRKEVHSLCNHDLTLDRIITNWRLLSSPPRSPTSTTMTRAGPPPVTLLGLVIVLPTIALLPPLTVVAAIPPHAVGYRAGVTGHLGDLGPRLPSSLRNSRNPCNRTTAVTISTTSSEGADDDLYDVCSGPYSFVRCRGHDPLLIADCIPKPRYRCWVDEQEHEASCGRPEPGCGGVGSSAEVWHEQDYEDE